MKTCLNELASSIDDASEKNDPDKLRELSQDCEKRVVDTSTSSSDKPILLFYQANCYAGIRHAKTKNNQQNHLSWQEDERVKEICLLRKAIRELGFTQLNNLYQCKIHTNLGNILYHLGRVIEAINQWNNALSTIPNFAMALGNKGSA